jgi:stress-induced morphogen
MNRTERIRDRISTAISVAFLDVIDETHMHGVPRDGESHMRVVVVSDAFDTLAPIARHRLVNSLLAEELARGLHALAIEARTPAQWAAAGGPALTAPPCRGGSRA